MHKNELLTTDELCAELGIVRRTLARWNHQRIGPPQVRVGGMVRYRRKAVDEWLRQNERRQARGAA